MRKKFFDKLSKAIAESLTLIGEVFTIIFLSMYVMFITTSTIYFVLHAFKIDGQVVNTVLTFIALIIFSIVSISGLYYKLGFTERKTKRKEAIEAIIGIVMIMAMFFLVPLTSFMGFLDTLTKYFKILGLDEEYFIFVIILNAMFFWMIVFDKFKSK